MKEFPRNYWGDFSVVDSFKRYKGNQLVLVIGADSPEFLEDKKAFEFAKKEAKKRGFNKLSDVSSIGRFGQNSLVLRKFYFEKVH